MQLLCTVLDPNNEVENSLTFLKPSFDHFGIQKPTNVPKNVQFLRKLFSKKTDLFGNDLFMTYFRDKCMYEILYKIKT